MGAISKGIHSVLIVATTSNYSSSPVGLGTTVLVVFVLTVINSHHVMVVVLA